MDRPHQAKRDSARMIEISPSIQEMCTQQDDHSMSDADMTSPTPPSYNTPSKSSVATAVQSKRGINQTKVFTIKARQQRPETKATLQWFGFLRIV